MGLGEGSVAVDEEKRRENGVASALGLFRQAFEFPY